MSAGAIKSPFAAAREFIRGVSSRPDRVFILSKGKALMKDGVAHTSVIAFEQGKWADCVNTDWDSTAIAVARLPAPKLVTIGENGDVVLYLGGGKTAKETIKPEPVAIRNARGIAGYVFACGMGRQVFKRVDERVWQDISVPGARSDEAAGFEAIDGYSEKEVYAVGWRGEIFQYDGRKWTAQVGPSSLILSAVCCAPDGVVYAAGQRGTLLRGRNGGWEQVGFEQEFSLDVWDLCWFKDKLYVATARTLFTLERDQLIEVDFGAHGPLSCYSLSTATDEVLWSVGKSDVASFDGERWRSHD